MHTRVCLVLAGTFLAASLPRPEMAGAQSLQETLNDQGVGNRWKYDDWPSAQSAALRSMKPIMALFR